MKSLKSYFVSRELSENLDGIDKKIFSLLKEGQKWKFLLHKRV